MTPTAIEIQQLGSLARQLLRTLNVTGTFDRVALAEQFGTETVTHMRDLERLGLIRQPYGKLSNALALTAQGRVIA